MSRMYFLTTFQVLHMQKLKAMFQERPLYHIEPPLAGFPHSLLSSDLFGPMSVLFLEKFLHS